jgi:hypothetical protein
MNSHQAILPDALRVNANLFQTDLCRNPGSMDGFKLTNHGTGYPLPGEHDELSYNELKSMKNTGDCRDAGGRRLARTRSFYLGFSS